MSDKKRKKSTSPSEPNADCLRCGSKCCRYFALPIEEPEDMKDFDDIRWYLLHEGVSVFVEDGDWYIQIDNKCKALTPEGPCHIYDDRPRICRKYKVKECEYTVPDGEYELLLRTPEECMAYAAKTLGRKALKREKRRKDKKDKKKDK